MHMLGNVFILGDSYSTFEGYIPDGYEVYYKKGCPQYTWEFNEAAMDGRDVFSVDQTWWYNLTNENGTLLKNCSWSGTTICNTGYGGKDNTDISFIGRIQKLIKENYFKENIIDTIFLFGGTNDSWANSPLGERKKSNWSTDDLYNVFPAFSYLINMLITEIPNSKIYCVINSELKPEITDFYKEVCKDNNVDVIELHDIDKLYGHPTIKGMQQIKNQIIDYINSNIQH